MGDTEGVVFMVYALSKKTLQNTRSQHCMKAFLNLIYTFIDIAIQFVEK